MTTGEDPGAGEQVVDLPLMLYVPTQPTARGAESVDIEMRHTADGRVALLGFSSLEELLAGCGDGQPWALIPAGQLQQLQGQLGFDLIALDTPLAEEQRYLKTETGP